MPKLVIAGLVHELTDELVTIGRAPDNTIVLYDPSVSARHAELELSGDTYRLKDLDSTNGTRVNGIPTTETVLRFDDRIRFGAVEARRQSILQTRRRSCARNSRRIRCERFLSSLP